jgi:hypothetical protein
MELEDNFNHAVEGWMEHCRNPRILVSCSNKPLRNCDPCKRIISMGYEALHLIREVYDRDSSDNFELAMIQGHGLVYVVRKIVGDEFSIPEEIRGNIPTMEEYTKRWLDENLNYIK